MGKETNLCKIPNDLYNYSIHEEGEQKSPLRRCPLCIVTSFWRVQCVWREGITWPWGTLKTLSQSGDRLTTTVISHADGRCPGYDVMNSALPLWSSCPKAITSVWLGEKHQATPSSRTFCGIADKDWSELSRSSKHGTSEKLSQPGGAYGDVPIQIWCGGTSLAVQWLRLLLPMQETRVQSLVGELRYHVPLGN